MKKNTGRQINRRFRFVKMLNSDDQIQEGFLCPECHRDMSNMEMLQNHYQTVHLRTSTSLTSSFKGLFSMVKQKLTVTTYQQYFRSISISQSNTIGYARSHDHRFQQFRQHRIGKQSLETNRLLNRLNQLTLISMEYFYPEKTKELRKHEKEIVQWTDEGVVSACTSCKRSFGFMTRKHHCRLDGLVICQTCSRFLTRSIAGNLINPTTLSVDDGALQKFCQTAVISLAEPVDPMSIRICLQCDRILQHRHIRLMFERMEKHPVLREYEKIDQARKQFESIHPTYSNIVNSLLSGETKFEIVNAQEIYQRMSTCHQTIDTISRWIASYPDSNVNSNQEDSTDQKRLKSICRNIRLYSIELARYCSIRIKPIPKHEEIQRIRKQKQQQTDVRQLDSAKSLDSNCSATAGGDERQLDNVARKDPFVVQYCRANDLTQQKEIRFGVEQTEHVNNRHK